LHRDSAALGRIDCFVPASANAQACGLRDIMNDIRVARSKLPDDLCCAVGRVIVDHDHVVTAGGALRARTADCVAYGLYPVAHWNKDTCMYRESEIRLRQWFKLRFQKFPNAFQVAGKYPFHLDLVLPTARIHVIELPLARIPRV